MIRPPRNYGYRAVLDKYPVAERFAVLQTIEPERHERYARVIDLRLQGLSLAKIGAEIGVSPERVRQLLYWLRRTFGITP